MDQFFGIFAADVLWFSFQCLPMRQIGAHARFQTIDPSSPACVWLCPAQPRNRTRWRVWSVRFLFLPRGQNTRSIGNPHQEFRVLFSKFVPTAFLLIVSYLWPFFIFSILPFQSWKAPWTPMPIATMELFLNKTIHWMYGDFSIPTVASHLMVNMHPTPFGLLFQPVGCFYCKCPFP